MYKTNLIVTGNKRIYSEDLEMHLQWDMGCSQGKHYRNLIDMYID